MPRYYCDYCDTYLTHDSPSVRKQHNAGYKHKANVRSYYQQFEEQQTQSLIDQRIKEHLGQAAAFHQVGAAYNQHLASMPGQRPRLPVLPAPVMPIPGAAPMPMVPGIRPPVLPRPITGAPGYGTAPVMSPNVGPPGAPSLPMQVNSLPRPLTLNMSTAAPGVVAPNSNNGPSQAMYQVNPTAPGSAPPSATGPADTFSYASAPEASH